MNVAPRFCPSPDTSPRARARPDPLEVLKLCAWARAELFAACEFDNLPDAVDPLWEYAIKSGLTGKLGVDGVQKILADSFHRVREWP
jgi:hypothetical protein